MLITNIQLVNSIQAVSVYIHYLVISSISVWFFSSLFVCLDDNLQNLGMRAEYIYYM